MCASKIVSPILGLSAGEPAGIGPDLCLMLARHPLAPYLVVAADRDMMEARARQLGVPYPFANYNPHRPGLGAGRPRLWHHPAPAPVRPGRLDPANSPYVLRCLDTLAQACHAGIFGALVTAPVQKSVIEAAGIPFTGHTEYLAAYFGVPRVVMMLVGGGLRVALATTHLPLRDVPDAITREGLLETLTVLHHGLRRDFGCSRPRILVAGLNPHAGESGHLGQEEIDVIAPALAAARIQGLDVTGPLPADTLFVPDRLNDVDAVLVMYHDQGLPVLKMHSFGKGVNVTLGLPIIRTSVDHGTALDRAGTGDIEAGSLETATLLALHMADARHGAHTA